MKNIGSAGTLSHPVLRIKTVRNANKPESLRKASAAQALLLKINIADVAGSNLPALAI